MEISVVHYSLNSLKTVNLEISSNTRKARKERNGGLELFCLQRFLESHAVGPAFLVCLDFCLSQH